MDFRCLGPLVAMVDGVPIGLGEPQRRLVLALLLSHADAVVSTDRLVDGIWGDEPPTNGRKVVQGYVSGLRKALGPGGIIESRTPGYRLNVKPQQVDALLFEKLATEGAALVATDPQRARMILGEALAAWRGDPYEDLADFDAIRPEIDRLDQLRSVAIEGRIEADILSGQQSAVLAELADLTRRYPLRERLWSLRMLALYRSGRQAEALRTYGEARGVLAAEVGLEPASEMRLLEKRILDHDPVLDTMAVFQPDAAMATIAKLNPYKGLRAFEETDAADFYGRDALVRRLREAMQRRTASRLVVLAGPSGSGKSSVVGAGLTPMLRAEGWSIATMYPGAAPTESLAAVLGELGAQPRSLLIVDQLEELITLAPDRSEAEFFDRLADLAAGQEGPSVVVTVRTDFLDRLLVHPRFARLVEPGLVLVTPLEAHEVRDVIVGPASRVGLTVEPDLVAAMVRDVAQRASVLPLMEFALTDLYDRGRGRPFTLEALEAAGGISGVLAKRAEELYASLDDAGRLTTRQLFLRLVTLTETGEAHRHRVTTESLSGMPQIDVVQDIFGQHRLVTFDRDPDSRPTVEVAHEALLREWPRLARWIDEASDSLRILQHLTNDTAEWEANDRADAYLVTASRLARYADWPDADFILSDSEQKFLIASRELQERERSRRHRQRNAVLAGFAAAAVIAIVLASVALVARNEAANNEATARSRELAASAVAVRDEDPELSMLLGLEAIESAPSGVSSSTVGVLALREALDQHRLLARIPGSFTTARISPDGSTIYVSSEPDRSVMALDPRTGEVAWTFQDPAVIDEVSSIFDLRILDLSVSPDGTLIAVSIPDIPTSFSAIAMRTDAKPGRVVVLNAQTGEVVQRLTFPECRLSSSQFGGFTADGKWLAVLTGAQNCLNEPSENWTTLFDTATWQEGPRIQIDGNNRENVYFTADGSRVLVHDLDAYNAELRSFPELELINRLPAGTTNPHLGPTGEQAIVNSPESDRRFLLVHADSGERIAHLEVNEFTTGDRFRFSADGSVVGVTTRSHDYVFEADTGQLVADLGNTGVTNSHDFSADGTRLVTANATGAQIWNLSGRAAATGIPLTVPGAEAIWIGTNAVVNGQDLAVRVVADDGPFDQDDGWVTLIVDPDTGSTIEHFEGDSLQLPDGRFVVAERLLGTEDHPLGPLVVVDPDSDSVIELDPCVALLADLREGSEIDCPGPFFSWLGFDHDHLVSSADGSYFAATSYAPSETARTVRVWNSSDLEVRSEFSIPYSQEAFAVGSSWIAVIDDRDGTSTDVIAVYDVDDGTVIAEIDGPTPDVRRLPPINAVTNDGSILLVADLDGLVLAFDTSSWEQVAQWQAHDAFLRGFAMSPDGAQLATTGQDEFVKIWDIQALTSEGSRAGPPPLLDRIPVDFPSDAAWISPDRLAVFSADAVEYVDVALGVDGAVAEATQRLTRSFTIGECTLYDIDPCPTLEEIRGR